MKKKLAMILAAALACSMLLAGCGDKEEETSTTGSSGSSVSAEAEEEEEPDVYDTEYLMNTTDYDITEYVVLGEYENLAVEVDSSYEVTDDYIIETIDGLLETVEATVEISGGAEEGDIVNIDYVGTMDGEEFDGGSSEDYDLELGSDTFIDGFEDGLIGAEAGDVVTLDLTFPDDYSSDDLAGEDVTFEVTVNSVYTYLTYEDLTDDLVSEYFEEDYAVTTIDELYDAITTTLENSLLTATQSAYLGVLAENSEVTLPDSVAENVEVAVEEAIESLEETLTESYGIEMEYYFELYGITQEEYEEEQREYYTAAVTQQLVLEALVLELGTEVTKEEVDAFVDYFVAYYEDSYGYTEDEFIEMLGGKAETALYYAEYYVVLSDLAETADVTFVEEDDDE